MKQASKHAYSMFCRWSYAITHHICWSSRFPTSKTQNFLWTFLRPWLLKWVALTTMPAYFHGLMNPKIQFLLMIVCYSSKSLLVIFITDVQNAKKKILTSFRPCLCIRLSLTSMADNFKGQTSHEELILLVSSMIVCYSAPSLLGIQIFYFKNAEISRG